MKRLFLLIIALTLVVPLALSYNTYYSPNLNYGYKAFEPRHPRFTQYEMRADGYRLAERIKIRSFCDNKNFVGHYNPWTGRYYRFDGSLATPTYNRRYTSNCRGRTNHRYNPLRYPWN